MPGLVFSSLNSACSFTNFSTICLTFFSSSVVTVIATLPFPLVFHSMFGFSLINFNSCISEMSSISSFMTAARYDVHIPVFESVSSIPM